HALASGFWSFAAARAVLGFGEGATFPGGLRTAVQTLPAGLRSRGTALAYSGGSLGAVITPLLVVPIAVRFGWRGAFWFTGLIGLAWLFLWAFVGRALRPAAPDAETYSMAGALRNSKLWAFMSAYALGGLPLAFVIYGAAIYLTKVLGLTQAQIGKLLWIPPLGWEVGYFFWGWIGDRLRQGGEFPYGKVFALLSLLSLPPAVTPALGSLPLLLAGMFLAMFVAAGFVILSIAYATAVFSSSRSGFLAGAGAGSWSAVVAIVMPLFGRMFDRGEFQAAFVVSSLFPVAGYLLWFAFSRGNRQPATAAKH
ncbi:MAG TPA: MFS transporter, partial [Bryobacteraceae bacterium]|nr:MFS transporter [Bryobacteraceae bacterium]